MEALYTADWPETQNAVRVAASLSKSVLRCSYEDGFSIFLAETEEIRTDPEFSQHKKWLAKGVVYYLLSNEAASHAFLSQLPENHPSIHLHLYSHVFKAGLEAVTYRNMALKSVIDFEAAVAQSNDALLQLRYSWALARTYKNNGYPAAALDQLERIVNLLEKAPVAVRWSDGALLTDVYTDTADAYGRFNYTQQADGLYQKLILNADGWFDISEETQRWVFLKSGKNAMNGINTNASYWQNHAPRALANLLHVYTDIWRDTESSAAIRGQTLYHYTDALIAMNRLSDVGPLLNKGMAMPPPFWMSADITIGSFELLAAVVAHLENNTVERDALLVKALSMLEEKPVEGGIFNLSGTRMRAEIRNQRFRWYQLAVERFVVLKANDVVRKLSIQWQEENEAGSTERAFVEAALARIYLAHGMLSESMKHMAMLPLASKRAVDKKDPFANSKPLFSTYDLAALDVMYGILLNRLGKKGGETYIENGLRRLSEQRAPVGWELPRFDFQRNAPSYSPGMQQAVLLMTIAEQLGRQNEKKALRQRALTIPLTGVEKTEITLRGKYLSLPAEK